MSEKKPKKEYIKLWVSYDAYFEPYSDEAVGRLARAMIQYKKTGQEPSMPGEERFIWPAIRRDIDEAAAAQAALSQTRQETGSQGGRPRGEGKPKPPGGNQKKQLVFVETKKSHGQGQGQGQGQEKGSCPDAPPGPGQDSAPGPGALETEPGESLEVKTASGAAQAASHSTTPDSFQAFWQAYPRKTAKQAARKAWDKLRPGPALVEAILAAVERDRQSDQWTRDGGQFVPYPATWLNGRRWEDEGPEPEPDPVEGPPPEGGPLPDSPREFRAGMDWRELLA